MAMDKSFVLESALKRFLSRCPELERIEKLNYLAKQGQVVVGDVINLMAELFINPNYTIPLIGCFRPIIGKVIDETVSLLRQCNLSYHMDDAVGDIGEFVGGETVYLLDYYVKKGGGLIVHELACLAFCRALDLDHSLFGSVAAYFNFAPPPFERILRKGADLEQLEVLRSYLHAARVSYRLLLIEPEFFSRRWDWSCFIELVETQNFDMGQTQNFDMGLRNDGSDVRWCSVQMLSIILKISEESIENFGVEAKEAASCLLRWEEFCQDVAIEKAGMFVESSDNNTLVYTNGGVDCSQLNTLMPCDNNSSASVHSCRSWPVMKCQRLTTWNDESGVGKFVMTSAMKRSVEKVLLAVSQRWPVLLYGPAGSGKSTLINKLAQDSGNRVLSIHMDEHIDGKVLIGTYVCSEQPGEFRWQPGSLVQAVLNGFWVVFEDIDKAPSDVQSILIPLLEGGSFFVTGHGEEIRVPENFQLFSTVSTARSDSFGNLEGGNLLSILWRRVMVEPPNTDDLQNIVKVLYPNLEPLAGKLIETFERVNYVSVHHILGFQSGKSALNGYLGRFSLRDLIKWCKRIAGLGFSSMEGSVTANQCLRVYQEAIDVFAAFSAMTDTRLSIMNDIAKLWMVPQPEAGRQSSYKPEVQVLLAELRIGRVALEHAETVLHGQDKLVKMRSSLLILEKILCSIKYNEPALLVGETGTGKTTLVQNLASMLGQKITILNLSQQSDVTDLLGGFKPIDPQSICILLYNEFESLFSKTFSVKENEKLFAYLQKQLRKKNWIVLLSSFRKYLDNFQKKLLVERSGSGKKRKKPLDEEILRTWEKFAVKVETAQGQIGTSSGMIFSFVEGAFVTALRKGEWILLDEVNLAPPETLQRITGVLEGDFGSLCLAERGDISHIPRHPSFRIFACMNPATDAGKRDLPHSLRSRFTEYFVDDVLDKEDLKLFVNSFMEETLSSNELEQRIIDFYETAKVKSEEKLQDGANQRPQYSLRSLYRALEYTKEAKGKFGFRKAIYDGFCMFFLTMLDRPSAKIMKDMIKHKLLGGTKPPSIPYDSYLKIKENTGSDDFLENYVLTRSVKKQLENLARAVFIKRYPVLLQGPTSSGKTSLVQYLAARTGHEFVRINNHEHTDLQEYLGSYISDAHGKLIFHEGALVKAVRNGYWIVLDELNLAPSDVLEALNRLLDDNRELYVPELRETIRAHPDFMLFATQNPPTFYGGRKMLSRAFRNRFVEVHVDEIPDDELSTIIEKRCKIPGSRAKLMVDIMKDLQLHRQKSKVFAGKHGFITPRDLFRWANRLKCFGESKEVMAEHGYYLLADRLRDEGEKVVVQEVLEKHLRVKIVKDNLYKDLDGRASISVERDSESLGNIIMTKTMRRLYFLVKRCYELHEPVLLVGETGGGKTTVCQLLSSSLGLKLHILNCHQYSETSDFLGGFYPIRERSRLASEFKYIIEQLRRSRAYVLFPQVLEISSDIGQASSTLDHLAAMITSYRQGLVQCDVTVQDINILEEMKSNLLQLHEKWQTIFSWQDGPLVQAMKAGDLFLVDEISLADDSVLERLNSVLEAERKLSLAEKGGSVMEKITAHENFLVLATMNPGGDYGKKELSPALRNRFTEIWVPSVSHLDELKDIALMRLSSPDLSYIVEAMINFWQWFNNLQVGRTLTVRDLLSWVEFINVTKGSLGPDDAFLHGLFLVLLDGLSLGTGISGEDAALLREKCVSFLLKQLKLDDSVLQKLSTMETYGWGEHGMLAGGSCSEDMVCDNAFGISPFYIEKGSGKCESSGFEFLAPTTRRNASRVLRAMQLSKPVLLEGSPGVGKTSLIIALGKYSGHNVVRINLSEQTDLMDLLGSDLPVESEEGMKFAWSDGILLQALKDGCWVLLDELNLAPQSVLEGLNAILDHRAEVFIPELGLTFKCPSTFRVFACQNPFSQGGGRKGLPRSFLNRFTKVYIDELVERDYLVISSSLYPSIPIDDLKKLIDFNKKLHEEVMVHRKYAQDGSPWEFNLRDVIRSCQIIQGSPKKIMTDSFLDILYVQRMRTPSDREQLLKVYEEVFGVKPFINLHPRLQITSKYLIVGNAAVKRNSVRSGKLKNSQLNIMPSFRHVLEAAAHCVQNQWLCILVGPPSSGKTSLIRLLAKLTGNVLNELNLSSATDISELLGCFEQYDASRNFREICSQVERFVTEYCSSLLKFSNDMFRKRKDVITKWLSFLSNIGSSLLSTSSFSENWQSIASSLNLLVEIIMQMELDVANDGLCVSWSINELKRAHKAISKLQEYLKSRQFSAKFEWVPGLLVKAIENGEWVVLENANLCNPTVLDRINSLVESGGSITVNECGNVDGCPVVLHPHPNFRMFLTINPSFGEVSRAMRNRGVEIYMMQPYWLLDEGSRVEYELKDVTRFLVLSGVPVGKLVDSMAKAHLYAKKEGLRFNIQISYLELMRWIKLFQQLLINGNQPSWSLQTSWEHTYLSSLGESAGWEIINHVKNVFLSMATPTESDDPVEMSLHLPGGWPMPLKLRHYVLYSKEASVKQNFMHLEYLLSQYELGILRNKDRISGRFSSGSQRDTYVIDLKRLHDLMHPNASGRIISRSSKGRNFDLKLAKKMLLYAVNWTIEQATEFDHALYLLWFSWLSSKLEEGHIFHCFENLVKQDLDHPIWKNFFRCRHDLASFYQVNLDVQPVPLLSLDWVCSVPPNEMPNPLAERLSNAVDSVGVLRLSIELWNTQSGHDYGKNDGHSFKLVLESLQGLEKEILDLLVTSPSYRELIELYRKLLDDHTLFWNAFISCQHNQLLLCWRSLLKLLETSKLRNFFPGAVRNVLMMGKKHLRKEFHRSSQKSLLWIHGGHPISPPSADLYEKLQQLVDWCKFLWATNRNPYELVNDGLLEVVASTYPELRSLAVEGICLSLYITSKSSEDNDKVVLQLDEIYQMLLERFRHEKNKLAKSLQYDEEAILEEHSASCCSFCPESLCLNPVFASRQDVLPIIDSTSYLLDMEVLGKLSDIILVDPKGLQQALSDVSGLLKSVLKYSLTFSAIQPQNFTPHQRILWTLEAWASEEPEQEQQQHNLKCQTRPNVNISSYILEMWFWWHSTLWNHYSVSVQNATKTDVPVPAMLALPVKTASVIHIVKSPYCIKDYIAYSWRLKFASYHIWQSPPTEISLPNFLLSVARSLFRQIILAHKTIYDADKFAAINSIFSNFDKNMIRQDEIHNLSLLIASSSDPRLNKKFAKRAERLLKDLFLHCSSTDFYHYIGFSWFRIGALRFRLLINSHDVDPSSKYSYKYSQLLEKISALELETKVRKECEYLAGSLSSREADKKRAEVLYKLEAKRKRLQKKLVFRSNPSNYAALQNECREFKKHIKMVEDLNLSNVQGMCNWQETANCFIKQLSDVYKDYTDVAQPVQVAVYEMKLGLSLILSGISWKNKLNRVEAEDVNKVMESVDSYMKFPRGYALALVSSDGIDTPVNFWEKEKNVLERLVSISSDVNAERAVSPMQLKASLRLSILLQIAYSVADAKRIDKSSLEVLDKIFKEFASMWMDMKVQAKSKESYEAQQFKFKPRAFEIKQVIDVDILTLPEVFVNDDLSEWQDLLSEDECSEKVEAGREDENWLEEWSHIPETVLDTMIGMHNKLFGSVDLVSHPGRLSISDADRLLLFNDTYSLGAGIMKGLGGLVSSSWDATLMPEHLLRICVEHEQTFFPGHKSTNYNFYKDANASEMAKMVKLLAALEKRIRSLLNEWEDHPGLEKILDTIRMLLAIPLGTPLAKALLGLRFLLNRVRVLEENGSKFSLSVQMEPITALICSWQKMEFDSWPALLDAVQSQYEMSAAKLWFPLLSVLDDGHADDVAATIESLERFICDSSVGEYRKRLQLLFSFLGQIMVGRCLEVGTYSSSQQEKKMEILYNMFGYYIQFLPRVLEHTEACRKTIEGELKEFLKLCRWDRAEACLSAENSKRTRQKLRKLVQKHTDMLQQPVMLILNQEVIQNSSIVQSMHGPRSVNVSETITASLNLVVDQLNNKDRLLWFLKWRNKVSATVRNLHGDKTSELCSVGFEDAASNVLKCLTTESEHSSQLEQWDAVWKTLEKISRATIDCHELWKDTEKSIGKRRAFTDLLNMLERCGLHKHKSQLMKESNNTTWWFIQPSYDIQHLLLSQSSLSRETSTASELQYQPDDSVDVLFKSVNSLYFRSTASVQLLERICLKPHEDITHEQASRSVSFMNHLLVIQQRQHAAAYQFAKHLNCLRECLYALGNLYLKCTDKNSTATNQCSISSNRHSVFKYMWKQKQLFDGLAAMLNEESLLLRTAESMHLKSCPSTRPATNCMLQFVENIIPLVQKRKELLDNYLVRDGLVQTLVQESLDKYLLGGVHNMSTGPTRPFVISEHMEQMVLENFDILKEFDKKPGSNQSSVAEALLRRLDDLVKKGKLLAEEFKLNLKGKPKNISVPASDKSNNFNEHCPEIDSVFNAAVKKTCVAIADLFKKQCSLGGICAVSEESLGNVISWEHLFKSAEDLNFKDLYDNLLETIFSAEKLINSSSCETSLLSSHIGLCFEHLNRLSDLIYTFGESLLQDLLVMLKTVSVMTHALANVLASLFSKGFGVPANDDDSNDKSQDATGTGMGEGSGAKDVSEQITDEDQLLGSSEKPNEEQDASGEVPNKNDKGIEMDGDFAADAFSVSEDSDEENQNDEDSDDEQLESAMGETGPDSEAIDEKSLDKEEENPDDTKEKFESGSSVSEKDAGSKELRGKEDSAADEEHEEHDDHELDEENDKAGNEDDSADMEQNADDMVMDKEEVLADASGLEPEKLKEVEDEDMNLDEDVNDKEELDDKEEGSAEDGVESAENENRDETAENADTEDSAENGDRGDEKVENVEQMDVDEAKENAERNEEAEQNEGNLEKNSAASRQDAFGLGMPETINDHVPNSASATQPNGDSKVSDSRDVASETNAPNANEAYRDPTPMKSLPSGSTSEMDMMVYDTSENGRLSDQQKADIPEKESSAVQKNEVNPYRNVGDALKEWKERARVSADLQAENKEPGGSLEDNNADEYGYVPEFDEGTAQALGPATSEQIDPNTKTNKLDEDASASQRDEATEMEIDEKSSEEWDIQHHGPIFNRKAMEQMQVSDSVKSHEEKLSENYDHGDGVSETMSENLVSVKKSYLNEDLCQLSKLSVDDDDLGKAQDSLEISLNGRDNAASQWRRYELLTTRLSQELAEQLRLVMEPTVASKLQGDYKTGKRINMKKVIPYIASHYRKDKIWLRRTRPNKRDYQVVIAVDDSRSMSESGCGDVAVESLVTVCRAMSQLELGSLAVTSFGKKGNIRLLHDFDHPFNGEAGMKIISNLTFQQENTIADEPVADLLKYLKNMLDTAVVRARLPCGQNPLQQLVLIIADGRFHEKERLKRYVRDFLSQKRMVAFLVLDSPQESIMDQMEASFVGEGDRRVLKFTKYLDSFPFPYYVVLRNVEALPRTLADLLRQWFELMQNSRD